MKPLLPFSRALLTWLHKNHFSPITPQDCTLPYVMHMRGDMIQNQRQINTSKLILKYPKYSSIRIFENSLGSDLIFVCCGKSLGSKLEIASWLGYDSELVKIWGRVCAILTLSWLVTSCAIIDNHFRGCSLCPGQCFSLNWVISNSIWDTWLYYDLSCARSLHACSTSSVFWE